MSSVRAATDQDGAEPDDGPVLELGLVRVAYRQMLAAVSAAACLAPVDDFLA